MNADLPHLSREELEVRLTALILGELPPAEAGAMLQLVARDPDLARTYSRLQQTIGLVREATTAPEEQAGSPTAPQQLSPERREKLLKHFKLPTPAQLGVPLLKPEKKRLRWIVPVASLVILLLLVGGLLFPMFTSLNQGVRTDASELAYSFSVGGKAAEPAAKAVPRQDQVDLALRANVQPPQLNAWFDGATREAAPLPRGGKSDKLQDEVRAGRTSGTKASGQWDIYLPKSEEPAEGNAGGVYSVNAVGYANVNRSAQEVEWGRQGAAGPGGSGFGGGMGGGGGAGGRAYQWQPGQNTKAGGIASGPASSADGIDRNGVVAQRADDFGTVNLGVVAKDAREVAGKEALLSKLDSTASGIEPTTGLPTTPGSDAEDTKSRGLTTIDPSTGLPVAIADAPPAAQIDPSTGLPIAAAAPVTTPPPPATPPTATPSVAFNPAPAPGSDSQRMAFARRYGMRPESKSAAGELVARPELRDRLSEAETAPAPAAAPTPPPEVALAGIAEVSGTKRAMLKPAAPTGGATFAGDTSGSAQGAPAEQSLERIALPAKPNSGTVSARTYFDSDGSVDLFNDTRAGDAIVAGAYKADTSGRRRELNQGLALSEVAKVESINLDKASLGDQMAEQRKTVEAKAYGSYSTGVATTNVVTLNYATADQNQLHSYFGVNRNPDAAAPAPTFGAGNLAGQAANAQGRPSTATVGDKALIGDPEFVGDVGTPTTQSRNKFLARAGDAETDSPGRNANSDFSLKESAVDRFSRGNAVVNGGALVLPKLAEDEFAKAEGKATERFDQHYAGYAVETAKQPAPALRLPMPTLKGTPEDLPKGANIEPPDQTVREQQAAWGELAKKLAPTTAEPAAGGTLTVSSGTAARPTYGGGVINQVPPELVNGRFAGGAPGASAGAPVVGDLPLVGKLFRSDSAKAEDKTKANQKAFVDGLNSADVLAAGKAMQDLFAKSTKEQSAGVAGAKPADSSALATIVLPSTTPETLAGSSSITTDSESRKMIVLADGEPDALTGQPGGVGGGAASLVQDGKLLWGMGKLDEAQAKLKQAREIDPANRAARYYSELVDESKNAPEGLIAKKRLVQEEAKSTKLSAASSAMPDVSVVESAKPQAERIEVDAKKRELESQLQFRNILNRKLAAESADQKLPKSAMVEIVDRAVPQAAADKGFFARLRDAVSGGTESKARIRIEPDRGDIAGLSENNVRTYDPYFIQTEYEVLQSEAVLGKAVDKLKLNETWGVSAGKSRNLSRAETVALLKKRIDVQPVKNTSLLEISVKSDKPEESAQIANAVADAYVDFCKEQRGALARAEAERLLEHAKEQEVKIAKLQQGLKESERRVMQAQKEVEPPPPPKPPPGAPIPQPEIATAENAFSTFSLNVADVSFKLAQASLEKGQMPDAASIRSEEFINALDYRDPEPQWDSASSLSGQTGKMPVPQPLGFAWERARFPFAHNRDALRFSVKTAAAGRQGERPLNLVLVLDNSGSMERADRVNIIREALRVLAAQLRSQDKVSVIAFARTARLWVDGLPGSQAGELVERVGNLTPQGGTDLGAALDLGYQTALRHYAPNGMNRVVILTDGAANLGDVDPDSLKKKVESHRKQGIALDCFGIGWEGYNDDLLEVLTRNGDGRYGFVNTPEAAGTEFAAQLAGALQVAASDVKVQVEFNPARVTNWRQVGYAKHQLTKQQFRDNTVDAAEIAAQEAGNGLYIIEVNPAGQGDIATVRVRYKVPGTTDYRELEWPVPYNGTAVPLEQASPAMRLLVASAEFSEWLASSPFSGEVSPDRLLRLLAGVPEIYGADERPKKLEWMIRQAKSISGR